MIAQGVTGETPRDLSVSDRYHPLYVASSGGLAMGKPVRRSNEETNGSTAKNSENLGRGRFEEMQWARKDIPA